MRVIMNTDAVSLRKSDTLTFEGMEVGQWYVQKGVVWVTRPSGDDEIYAAGCSFLIERNVVVESLSEEACLERREDPLSLHLAS